MSDKKITDLTDGGAIQDADEFIVARSGSNNKIAGSQVAAKAPVQSVFGRTGAVAAANGDYNGIVASSLTGATAATRYVGATTSGAPVSGSFLKGDFIITQDGHIYICTVAGSPGTWTQASGGSSSPLTTKGDVWGFSTVDARIPVGSNGQILVADSTQALGLKWATPSPTTTGGDTLNTVATSGSAQTINWATADTWDITLTAACTLTLSSVTSGVPITLSLILRQDGTGSRTVTWPASVSWLGGYVPVLQTSPSSVDVLTLFTVNGGTNWYGFAASEITLDWKQAISGTCTYASGTTFTCSGDQTGVFKVGKKLRISQSSVLKYFVIVGSSYNGTTTTTVTITGGADYSLANSSLDQVLISTLDMPDGWPSWFNFTPSTTGITSESSVARFGVTGRKVTLAMNLTGTSSATTKTITLPITPANIVNIQWICPLTVKDNGTVQTTPGEIVINPNNASSSLFKNTAAGAWTGSGTWFAIGTGTYEF